MYFELFKDQRFPSQIMYIIICLQKSILISLSESNWTLTHPKHLLRMETERVTLTRMCTYSGRTRTSRGQGPRLIFNRSLLGFEAIDR